MKKAVLSAIRGERWNNVIHQAIKQARTADGIQTNQSTIDKG